jgi:hypothetical protein
VSLKGGRELRSRLRAIKTVFKPVAREWTQEVVAIARPADSCQYRAVRANRYDVAGCLKRRQPSSVPTSLNFIDAGVKAHDIKPKRGKRLKFETGGRTVFAKKVHKRSTAAQPFKKEAAQRALEKIDILSDLMTLWRQATR